jgi:hypothetical protein
MDKKPTHILRPSLSITPDDLLYIIGLIESNLEFRRKMNPEDEEMEAELTLLEQFKNLHDKFTTFIEGGKTL